MATHSSVLAWRIPGTEEPGIYGVAQSRTGLKQISSSSINIQICCAPFMLKMTNLVQMLVFLSSLLHCFKFISGNKMILLINLL